MEGDAGPILGPGVQPLSVRRPVADLIDELRIIGELDPVLPVLFRLELPADPPDGGFG